MGLFKKSQKERRKGQEMVQVAGAQSHDIYASNAALTAPPFNPHDGQDDDNYNDDDTSIALGAEATAERIVDAISESFERGVPYMRIHTSILVACHSEQAMSSGLFSEEASVVYSDACYHDLSDFAARDTLDPHVFEMVADAYMHMRRLRQDQAIVLSGVSGSGKSETARLIMDQLCVLASNSGRHNTRAQNHMSCVATIIDAFSAAQTEESLGATRVGLWHEVQFSERGHIAGSKAVAFGLDRWRVTHVQPGERTFNVFYYLLHGSTSAERQQWQFRHGGDESGFRYLSAERQAGKALAAKGMVPVLSPDSYAGMMDQLRAALKACGLGERQQHAVFQVLAAILHLGNVEFTDAVEREEDAAGVRNPDEVDIAAELLGVPAPALTAALCYKTALVGSDLCTVFLNSHGASGQRDAFARALYQLLHCWLVEHLNQTTGNAEAANHVAVLQMYGFTSHTAGNGRIGSFEQFAVNAANERLHGFVLRDVLSEETGIARLMHDDAASGLAHVPWSGRLQAMHMLHGDYLGRHRNGVVGALEAHAAGEQAADDIALVNALNRSYGQNSRFIPGPPPNKRDRQVPQFGVHHYLGSMMYSVDGFSQHNVDLEVSPDFYSLFKDSSRSALVRRMFGVAQIALDYHPEDDSAIVGTFVSTRPATRATVRASPGGTAAEVAALDSDDPANTFVGEVGAALEDVFAAADQCKLWHVLHIKPNDSRLALQPAHSPDSQFIAQQVHGLALVEMSQRRAPVEFTVSMRFDEFVCRYTPVAHVDVAHEEARALTAALLVERIAEARGWERGQHYTAGHHMLFMTERVWRSIEVELRAHEKQRRAARQRQRQRLASAAAAGGGGLAMGSSGMLAALAQVDSNGELLPPHIPFDRDADDAASTTYGSDVDESEAWSDGAGEDDACWSDGAGDGACWGSGEDGEFEGFGAAGAAAAGGEKRAAAPGGPQQPVEEIETTRARRCWAKTTRALTWMVPDWAMGCCGLRREDMRMAWREKVAICLIILGMWGVVLFFIIGLGLIMCPKQYVYTMDEVAGHTERSDAYVAMRGRVYDITNFLNQEHGRSRGGASPEDMILYSGQEINASFPLTLRAACPELVSAQDDPHWLMYLKSDIETEMAFPFIHRAGSLANSKELMRQDFYYRAALPKMRPFRVGDVVWDLAHVQAMHRKAGQFWRIINGEVFNMGPYFQTRDAPENIDAKKWHFLHRLVESIFEDAGARDTDITKYWNMLPLPRRVRQANYRCLKSLFYVGRVDTRHSFRCLFPNFLLLAAACMLMLVITIKFLASLQLSSRRKPQKHDKFVICQVPCYTEGEASLRRTIDTLATLGYNDKHRLLFIICDGNIVGSGNDRPTPRIVLDILGVDPKLDPPGRAFRSIGEGAQQHNVAKVYSGLYEYEGHVVPYLVVAKVGKPSEKSRPGNRGKRDSQMLLLHFLSRVHFEAPMSPLDLEIYHQMKNVIGVHPSLYEYLLMVDADTEVLPDSLTRLVSCMVHDAKVIGICGETMLTNEDFSWTTMIQVYEYFISHHMAKAFESLFGSVTCLPGCFCMYRLRTSRGLPLIISKNVVRDYSENHVDTLHKKNLLSLGEDRYLTTLMMKYFPQYKMTFTPDAKSKTTAPDTWSVLLSQRRRWINSTVHNLAELMFLPEMCGFCCFSMRFVVFIDLLGTLTMPCTLFYLVYLVYLAVTKIADIGYISLILIGAIYGLQAVIFVLKRQWQHIGWMVIYLLAYPLWSFFIPIYAFWHMDDFSWGNTRIVVGDDGRRQIFVKDEDPFDPDDVPMKTWAAYEAEILERQMQIEQMEAVAQAIDEFGNNGVRPVSRFTELPMPHNQF
ncbi:hypothetical protein GGI23_000916 [Coemansia sp. RSA 2559]|nr:hypothetical protein GGI23_000916 [Coemansia sp. RSA 2559]